MRLMVRVLFVGFVVACERGSGSTFVQGEGSGATGPVAVEETDETPALTLEQARAMVAPVSGAVRPWDGAPGSMIPPYTAKALDGRPVAVNAEYRGEPLLLNFWATWCVPCRQEFPALAELQSRLGQAGLRVVGVSLDTHMQTTDVQQFVERQEHLTYRVLHDRDNLAEPLFGVPPLPGNFVFDAEGRLIYGALGAPEGSLEMLEAAALVATSPAE